MIRYFKQNGLFLFVSTLFVVPSIAAEAEEGFVSLFNGKDLSGWVIEEGDADSFVVKAGTIYASHEVNFPTWLRSEKVYENFDLRFEFRRVGWVNSGVFFHAPLHGRNSKVGFEYQIDQKVNELLSNKTCGAIFGVVPPQSNELKPSGQWNSGRILMDWPSLKFWMNDVLIQDLNVEEHEELKYRLRRGYIGLQALGYNVWFRNIRIKELPDKEEWIPLFNGKDFSGWYEEGSGADWFVKDGVLRAENGTSYMVTEEEFEDFELHAYVRTCPHANGGIFVRWNQLQGGDRGNEIQIENIPDSNYPTGSLYNIVRAEQFCYHDEEWFLMQIRLEGSHLVIRVNGETVVDYDQHPTVRSGHISLQMHKGKSWIEFKDLKVKKF